jgi:hypothetical protein
MVRLALGVVFAIKVLKGKRSVEKITFAECSADQPAEDAAERNLAESNQAELKASSPYIQGQIC